MANRQVATRDFSWYGQGHTSEDNDHRQHMADVDTLRRKEGGGVGAGLNETDSQRKRFTLPIEPTESVDGNRDYPPIVTVDGSVDTDIDHLMEHPEEEAYIDAPAQDIPSRFPKPHIIRVIDGSLDDDIDNLMNHDGTMAHTLVDTPKNLIRGDLKEINSKKSTSPKKDSIQDQADRSFNKITRDDLDDDRSGSELVPYFERNNSSKQVMCTSEADFIHLKQNNTEKTFGPPVIEMDMKENDSENANNEVVVKAQEEENGGSATKDDAATIAPVTSVSVEVEPGLVKDKVIQLEAINSSDEKLPGKESDTQKGHSDKKDTSERQEQRKQLNEHSSKREEAAELLERLLHMMPKKELEKRLGINLEYSENSADKKNGEKSLNESKAESQHSNSFSTFNEESSDTPMQDAICLLKHTLENMSCDLDNTAKSDSQKSLMVTALKVAGDSMNAAAKMADALSLLVKANESKIKGKTTDQTPSVLTIQNIDAKTKPVPLQEADDVLQSKTRSRSLNDERKKRLSERQNKSRVPENLKFIGISHEREESDWTADGYRKTHAEEKKDKTALEVGNHVIDRSIRDKRQHKSKTESLYKTKRGEEEIKHSVYRKEVIEDGEEERIKEKHREKSRSQYSKDELEKKSNSHRRSKTPKDKRKKSLTRHAQDEFDESPEVKQRNKQDRERRQERQTIEDRKSPSSKNGGTKDDMLPWALPENENVQRKGYFDQVIKRLKPFSPPRYFASPTQEKEIIRAKLVGSCVDPGGRDSDFDSIEFNGNARMSDSTLVHYGDEQESD